MIKEINQLKAELDAVILAHNYQISSVQEVADLVGDSLELSRAATKIDCSVIIFCGVDFMAETATVLSPEKKVILPDLTARCPMAQMITSDQLSNAKDLYPEAAVVCYVNSTAEVKAESDISCTSANAISIVNSLPHKQVLFVPDENLARYVARFTNKEIIPWNGYCYVHSQFQPDEVQEARKLHPLAEVLVHPECRPELIDLADHVYSTSGMGKHARSSKAMEFVIDTEAGLIYRLKKENPEKEFYPLSEKAICRNIKKTNLEKVLNALQTLEPEVEVQEDIAAKAKKSIERMLPVKS